MRGSDRLSGSLISYVNLDDRVPARHPLRKIKSVVDAALVSLDGDFAALYAPMAVPRSRPSGSFARASCRSCSRSDPSGS